MFFRLRDTGLLAMCSRPRLTPLTRPNQLPALRKHGEGAKERAGVKCRFHDLKHTAVSRMLDAGVPIAKIAKIVGWSPATMVRMSARYGHFGLEDLRGAVETISRPAEGEIDQGSPVNPPGMSESPNSKVN
jgi:integrase